MKNIKIVLIILCSLGLAHISKAQLTLGTEFKVNTTTVNQQRNPAVGVDSLGNSVVVWESYENAADQYGIFVQRFDPTGAPLGVEFMPTTVNVDAQRFPDVSVNRNGQTAIVWQSMNQDGSGNGVYRRIYNNAGIPISSVSRANSFTAGNQIRPKVAMAANGNCVVVWMEEIQDGDGFGIYARQYLANGAATSSQFQINDITVGYQGYPDIAMKPNGDFTVTWQSMGTDGSGQGIYAKHFDASRTALGGQFLVNTTTAGNQQEPSIAYKANGDFGIVWSSYGQDGSGHGVYGKLYNAAGVVIKPEFLLNSTTAGNQLHAEIAASPGEKYFVSWTNEGEDGDRSGVSLTTLNANGTQTPVVPVNTRTTDYQQFSALASSSDTTLQIVNQDGLEQGTTTHDGDRYGIYSRKVVQPKPVYDTLNPSTCAVSYTAPSGAIYASSGTYFDSLFSVENYDSVFYVINLTVNTLPTIVANASPNDTLCTGDALTLAGSGAATYLWTGGVTNNAPFVPASSGSYIVTGTDVNGCVNVDTIDIVLNNLPSITASVSPNDTVCAGASVILSGAGTISYSWTGGVTDNTSFIPASSNTYTVTGTDANGCTNTASQSIVVNTLPAITASASPNDTVCAGGSLTLNGVGGVSYSWTGGVTNNTSFIPASSNTYTVTGTDANGCTNTASQSIIVNTLPSITASVSPNDTVCVGGSLTLNGVGGVSYSWTGGVTDNTSFIPASSNTYTVTGTDANGCTNTASQSIVVNTLPTITASASPNDTVCAGGSLTLNGVGGVSYSWTGGVTNNASFIPASSNTYTVTGTDANGCTNTASQSIVVNTLPTITASASPNDTVCAGGSVTLNGVGGVSYSWTGGVTNNTSFIPASSTSYTVTGTDANGCSNTASQAIVVNTLPTITASVSPNDTVCSGGSVTLNGVGGVSYSWTGGVTNNASFVPASSTSYTVTGTDANGCSNTASQAIVVNTLPTITASVSPNDTVCTGGSVILNGVGGVSYSWTGGVTDNTSFIPASSTSYTVTGTDANGCTNTASQSIVVKSISSASISPSVCDTYTSPSTNYTWTTSGTYMDTIVNAAGCDSIITVNLTINISSTITISPTTVAICSTSSSQLVASGAVVYQWMPGSVNGSTLLLPANATSGTYTIFGLAANGCTATASIPVTVSAINGNLSQAMAGNTSSVPGSQIDTIIQPNDGQTYSYFDGSCNIIASVQEAAGGVSLGMVTSSVTVAATVPSYNSQPYVARWFDISPENQEPSTITLYYTDDDFIDYNAANGSFPNIPTNAGAATTATNLAITKTNGPLGTNPPTVINVVANWNATDARWEITFPVTGFSQFRLHTRNPGNAALTIDLTSFTVEKQATTDLVKWTTSSETNNSHFNVQRSNDGSNFEVLGKIYTQALNGNSSERLDYTYIDQQPLMGHNYYRLEQVDIDENKSYSKIVDIMWLDGNVVRLYPNPTNDIVNIDFSLTASSQTEIKLIDMSGRVVKSILSNGEKGMNHSKISMSELANGVYHIELLKNGISVYNSKVRKY